MPSLQMQLQTPQQYLSERHPTLLKSISIEKITVFMFTVTCATYGAVASRPEILKAKNGPSSFCILRGFSGKYSYHGEEYDATAAPGRAVYDKCRREIGKALKLNAPCKAKNCTFDGVWNGGGGEGQDNIYAASTFYYLAANVGFIDSKPPSAIVTPVMFRAAALKACRFSVKEATAVYPNVRSKDVPYTCMDHFAC